jgi:hypothetical protein
LWNRKENKENKQILVGKRNPRSEENRKRYLRIIFSCRFAEQKGKQRNIINFVRKRKSAKRGKLEKENRKYIRTIFSYFIGSRDRKEIKIRKRKTGKLGKSI